MAVMTRMTVVRNLLTGLWLAAVLAGPARALNPSAQEAGSAGGLSMFTTGAEAVGSNLASLGADEHGSFWMGAGQEGGNNTATGRWFTGLFQETLSARTAIVNAASFGGWSGVPQPWNGRIDGALGGGFAVKGVGLAYLSHADWTMVTAPFPLVQYTIGDAPTLNSGTHVIDGRITWINYTEAVLSYAHALPEMIDGLALSAGASAKYLDGRRYRSVEDHGTYVTTALQTPYYASMHRSDAGTGFGADVGLSGTYREVLTVFAAARNLGARINWSNGVHDTAAFNAAAGTFALATTTGNFSTTLPLEVLAGIGARMTPSEFSAGAVVESAGDPAVTTIRVGLEQHWSFFALRLGILIPQGPYGSMMVLGLGIGSRAVHLDAAQSFMGNGDTGLDTPTARTSVSFGASF